MPVDDDGRALGRKDGVDFDIVDATGEVMSAHKQFIGQRSGNRKKKLNIPHT